MKDIVSLQSPAGNSYLESPNGDAASDRLLQVSNYGRSRQQQMDIGLLTAGEQVRLTCQHEHAY